MSPLETHGSESADSTCRTFESDSKPLPRIENNRAFDTCVKRHEAAGFSRIEAIAACKYFVDS